MEKRKKSNKKTIKNIVMSSIIFVLCACMGFLGISNLSNSKTVFAATYPVTTLSGTGVTGSVGYVAPTFPEVVGLTDGTLLQTSESVSGTWADSFEGTSYDTLLELSGVAYEDGNFYLEPGQGDGSLNDTYKISTALELAFLGKVASVIKNASVNPTTNYGLKTVGCYFELDADIDLAGKQWVPLFNFSYTYTIDVYFNGAGHTISNAFVEDLTTTGSYASIFGGFPGGEIKDLTILNANIIGTNASVLKSANNTSGKPTNFTNITIQNSKVMGNLNAYGISDRANIVNNCKVVNCEIIAERNEDPFDTNFTLYSAGFGSAREIKNTNTEADRVLNSDGDASNDVELRKYGVFNTKVSSIVTVENNTTTPTSGRTYTLYANGVVMQPLIASELKYSNIFVENNEVISNCEINNTNRDLALTANRLDVYEYANGFGYMANSPTSGVNNPLQLSNIEIKNIKVLANHNFSKNELGAGEYAPSFYSRTFLHANGLGYLSSPTTISGVENDDWFVRNCNISNSDVLVNYDINYRRAYETRTDLIRYGSTVSGLVNTTYPGMNVDSCNVTDCNLNNIGSVNITAENSALNISIQESDYTVGIASGFNSTVSVTSGNTIKNSNITNSYLKSITNISLANSTFTNNATAKNSVFGVGIGNFDDCGVNNCELISEAVFDRDVADTTGSDTAYCYTYGLGRNYNNSNISCNVINCNITDSELRSWSDVGGTSRSVGTVMNGDANTLELLHTGTTITNTSIYAISLYNAYAIGMGYNTYTLASSGNGFNYSNCKLTGCEVISKSTSTETSGTNGVAYAIGLSLNSSTANGGNSFENCEVSDSKILAYPTRGEGYAIGMGYNTGSCANGANNYINCKVLRNNIIVDSSDGVSNVFAIGMGYNTNATNGGNDYTTCESSDNNIKAFCKQKIGYVMGMGYNTGSTGDSNNYTNCISTNNTLYSTSKQEGEGVSFKYVSNVSIICGLGFNNSSTYNNYDGCTVTNLNARALGANFTSFSSRNQAAMVSGMGYNGGSSSNDIIINNNKVINAQISAVAIKSIIDDSNPLKITYTTPYDSTTAGMFINFSGRKCVVTNNEVIKPTLSSTSDSKTGSVYSVGLINQGNQTYSNWAELNNNIVSDADITAEYSGGATVNVAAAGIALQYIRSINNCISSGSIYADNQSGNASFAAGIGFTNGIGLSFATRPNDSGLEPITSITNCYNYATVVAESTEATTTGASGIGTAESFDGCYNAGTVIGTMAGGITQGVRNDSDYTASSATNQSKYSFPIYIKNCVNAGNVSKSRFGVGYIGGIIGYYRVYTETYLQLILENNVSMGNVYSGYTKNLNNEIIYEQNAAYSSCYLGTIYGQIYLRLSGVTTANITADPISEKYENILTRFSLKNNYSLINSNINAGLTLDETNPTYNGTSAKIPYIVNIADNNIIRSTDGSFDVSANTQTVKVFTDLYDRATVISANTNSNSRVNAFSPGLFNITVGSELETYMTNNNLRPYYYENGYVPQLLNSTITYKVLEFNTDGINVTAPNPIVVKLNEGNAFSFSAPDLGDDLNGYTVVGWNDIKNSANSDYVSGTTYEDVTESLNYPIFTLYAVVDYTVYIVEFDANVQTNSANVYEEDTIIPENKITLENTNLSIRVQSTETSVTTVEWKVFNGVEYELIAMTVAIEDGAGDRGEFDLSRYFNTEFIETYAQSRVVEDITEHYFDIQVTYNTIVFHNIIVESDVTGEDSSTYDVSLTVSGVGIANGMASEGSSVVVTITEHQYYEFSQIRVGDYNEATGSFVDEGTAILSESRTYTISNISADTLVVVKVVKIEYGIAVNLLNPNGFVYPSVELKEELINDYATVENLTISINENIPQISVKTNVVGYKFEGFKLYNGLELGYTESSNLATIIGGSTIDPTLFYTYINSGNEFVINIVLQKQFTLTLNLSNPLAEATGEELRSTYEIVYKNENNEEIIVEQLIDDDYSSTKSLILNEGTSADIRLTAEPRVNLSSITSNAVNPNNIRIFTELSWALVNMNEDITIFATFVEKPSYNVVVKMYDQQGRDITSVTSLLVSGSLTMKSLGDDNISLPQVQVTDLYGEDGVGYEFIRFDFVSPLINIQANIDRNNHSYSIMAGYTEESTNVVTQEVSITKFNYLTEEQFYNYLNNDEFVVNVIFQKLFRLDVALNTTEAADRTETSYTVKVGETTLEDTEDNNQYWINEGVLSIIEVSLDARDIFASATNLDAKADNFAYVTMNEYKVITLVIIEKTAYSIIVTIKDQNGYDITTVQTGEELLYTSLIANLTNQSIQATNVLANAIPSVTANMEVTDPNEVIRYSFLGWRLRTTATGQYLESVNGVLTQDADLTDAENINTVTQDELLAYVGSDDTFELIAVYQRLYRLDVALNTTEAADRTETSYTVKVGETTLEDTESNNQYWINEGVLSIIEVSLDARDIFASATNSDVKADNFAYVTMNEYKVITLVIIEKTAYSIIVTIKDQNGYDITTVQAGEGLLYTSLIANLTNQSIQATNVLANAIPSVTANMEVTDPNEVIRYSFLGWRLRTTAAGEYLESVNGVLTQDADLTDAENINTVTQDELLAYVGSDDTFELIAVYQRLFKLNVTLSDIDGIDAEEQSNYASDYKVEYDINADSYELDSDSDGYWIEEKTLVKVRVLPNKRVTVTPEDVNIEFGANTAYIPLNAPQNLVFNFEIKVLNIERQILTVLKPADNHITDGSIFSTKLIGAIDYEIKNADGSDKTGAYNKDVLHVNEILNVIGSDNATLTSAYRFIRIALYNVNTETYDVLVLSGSEANNELTVSGDFYNNYVSDDGNVIICMTIIRRWKVDVNDENLIADGDKIGSYTVSILNEDDQVADASRYTVLEDKTSYYLDNGLKFKIQATPEKYARFSNFQGLFENEGTNNIAIATASADRAISVNFEKIVYDFDASIDASIAGEVSYTKNFKLGDTIQISYTPANNYQITEWQIGGKSLEDLGAVRNGNTITLTATKSVMDSLAENNFLSGTKLTMESDIETMMSPTLFYGIIIGGIVLLIMTAVISFLIYRSQKLKKQKEERDKIINDMSRKFNMGDYIQKLRDGSSDLK